MSYLRFRDDLVDDVLSGEKWLTIRYLLDREIRPGDDLDAIDEDGDHFADLPILWNTAAPLWVAREISDLVDGHKSYSSDEALIDELADCYDPPPQGFGPKVPLRLVFWRPLEGDVDGGREP